MDPFHDLLVALGVRYCQDKVGRAAWTLSGRVSCCSLSGCSQGRAVAACLLG